MKESILYDKLKNNTVQCNVCMQRCNIQNNKRGLCKTRENIDGVLYSLLYGKLAMAPRIEPQEKKVFFNFYPRMIAYSICSVGCSFNCSYCQNWQISRPKINKDFYIRRGMPIHLREVTPKFLKEDILKTKAKSLCFTFTEPSIWIEWVLDVLDELKDTDIIPTMVTNGYSTPEATRLFIEHGIKAVNIDIKYMSDKLYREKCNGSLYPVLDNIKEYYNNGVHVEIVNLLIPEVNDSEEDIRKVCNWILDNLDNKVPIHFSEFRPSFPDSEYKRTTYESIDRAYDIAREVGLLYPYVANIYHDKGSNTYCPKCNKVLLNRFAYQFIEVNIYEDKCIFCQYDISNDIKGYINQQPEEKFNKYTKILIDKMNNLGYKEKIEDLLPLL